MGDGQSADTAPLPAALQGALETFSALPNTLIALDFDGTLAPLVDDPMESRMLPEARSALLELGASTGVTVALVSGRAIDSLKAVAEPSDDWYLVGSHGGEVVGPGEHHTYIAHSRVPKELDDAFSVVVEDHPGTRLEKKAFGLALHTRGVDPDVAARAEQAARDVCEAFSGRLRVLTGHGILECSVLEATKADGIAALREATRAQATLFAGDDITDEDAISTLGSADVGIWVGPGSNAAKYRLTDARAVSTALRALVELKAAGK